MISTYVDEIALNYVVNLDFGILTAVAQQWLSCLGISGPSAIVVSSLGL